MRSMLALALIAAAAPSLAMAQAKPAAAAPAAAPAAAATPYTTAETPIGTLLDDPAAKAILVKHVPGLVGNAQIDMARSMTLKAIQGYAGDALSDAKLADIDYDLAKLAAKK